ncbi:hypothetical protein ACFFX0_25195 [Citricoccus parietis]|uniref:Uncharacterized protein n=1 Tax=Citricoccus parietis TaxID=592307 RepID=A0ABV5G5U7_9MICC
MIACPAMPDRVAPLWSWKRPCRCTRPVTSTPQRWPQMPPRPASYETLVCLYYGVPASDTAPGTGARPSSRMPQRSPRFPASWGGSCFCKRSMVSVASRRERRTSSTGGASSDWLVALSPLSIRWRGGRTRFLKSATSSCARSAFSNALSEVGAGGRRVLMPSAHLQSSSKPTEPTPVASTGTPLSSAGSNSAAGLTFRATARAMRSSTSTRRSPSSIRRRPSVGMGRPSSASFSESCLYCIPPRSRATFDRTVCPVGPSGFLLFDAGSAMDTILTHQDDGPLILLQSIKCMPKLST